jgi:predicted  nucleic acid-binding Zn-ribbon protein
MQKTLEMLLKLQTVDYDLGELERSKTYLPDMIKKLEDEITQNQEALENYEKESKQKNIELKETELEIASLNAELEKLLKKMKEIKTNREYDAITSSISTYKLKITENEDNELKLLNNLDELKEKIQEYKQKVEDVTKNNTAQLVHLRKQMGSIDEKIKIKQDERKNVVVRVDKKILSTYERVRGGKDHAVVFVKKRACGGCYKSLPPQRVQEIRKEDQIITCDSCGRILVWSEDENQ